MDALLDHFGHDEEYVVSNAITMMVGGFHTTGNFLTWTLYYLAIYPHLQEKVFEEVKKVIGQKGDLKEEDMEKLT
jgi:cytochrome P450 family 20 subfamily A